MNPNATEYVINSVHPYIVKTLLYFIYTDTLPPLQPGMEYELLLTAKQYVPEKVERVIQCLTNGMPSYKTVSAQDTNYFYCCIDITASVMEQHFGMLLEHQR